MESDSENSEGESREHKTTTSVVPRGGPIYLPNMVGNISTTPEFKSSFLNVLQDLETHLSLDSTSSSSQQFDVSYVFLHQLALFFIS
jgi:snRNA-activating protein complex subunit 3